MRVAHCSDLHLLSLKGSRWLDFANKRWIGGLNLISNRGRHHLTHIWEAMMQDLNEQKVDHILVTGDVTNLALDQEFRFAKELFGRLDLGPKEITVIPGNHDAYVAEGAQFFRTHFGAFCQSDDEFAWADGHEWPCIRKRGPLALFGLSTSLRTPWFTAYGVLGEEQCERLQEALQRPEFADCARLVAIHHSPAEPRARSRVRGLRDRKRLYSVLAEAGAELVLHGHEHLDLRAELPAKDGKVPVRGIQSGTYDSGDANLHRRARYRIYEFANQPHEKARAGVISEELRLWDPDNQVFTRDEEALPPMIKSA